MYQKGIPAKTIAALTRTAESVVRYHLAVARKQIPVLGLNVSRPFHGFRRSRVTRPQFPQAERLRRGTYEHEWDPDL